MYIYRSRKLEIVYILLELDLDSDFVSTWSHGPMVKMFYLKLTDEAILVACHLPLTLITN